MNGDMNLHTLGSGGAGQGLAATNAPIAKIACAASTMIVPSTLPGQTCQLRADAPLARDVRAGRRGCSWRPSALLLVEGLVEGDQALLQAEDGGLGAVGQPQLGQDAGHVRLDGLLADLQRLGDLAVGAATGQRGQDLQLPRGDSWSSARRPTAAWRTSRTSLAAIRGSSTLSPRAAARTAVTTWSTPAVLGR
jgi:hypothetical protein